MVMNIANALAAYRQTTGGVSTEGAVSQTGTGNFADTLKDFTKDAVSALQEGEKAAGSAAAGKGDIANIVTAISKAELMLQTVVTIRDRVIAAYQDISKTQI